MENTFSPLIAELTQIKELMLQLEAQLYYQPFPIELSKSLVSKALLAAEKSICMANKPSFCCPSCGPEGMSPPHSASGSPRSEGSVDHASKFHERREFLKKRKTLPTRRSQVKVGGAESGVETPFDDGYSWRKYGQKDILGAKYPRGYYRCTHKNTQGCPASKQVQRTDEDPTVYDVIYHGVHTCQQRPQSARAKAHEQITHRGPAHVGPLHALQPGLAVKTEGPFGPSSAHEHLNCVPFAFPSTTIESINNNNNNNNIYFSSHAWEDCYPGATVGGRFSPSFVSPATSESNYFSPPLRGLRLHKSESDLTEVVSAATSTTNSPMADMDFMLDGLELDPSFHLDASSFFS